MYVENLVSGHVGQVRSHTKKPKRLYPAHHQFVAVRTMCEKSNIWRYPFWYLPNVEEIPRYAREACETLGLLQC